MHNTCPGFWNYTLSSAPDEHIETLNDDISFAGEHCVGLVGLSPLS